MIVSRKRAIDLLKYKNGIDRVLSINDVGYAKPKGTNSYDRKSLVLYFNDLICDSSEEELILPSFRGKGLELAPSEEHIRQIIDSADALLSGDGILLVHCTAGVSRSTAATYILLSTICSPAEALEIVRSSSNASKVDPNPMMVRLAQEMLGKDLLSALENS